MLTMRPVHVLTRLGQSDLGTITGTYELTWEDLAAFLAAPKATSKAEIPLVVGARFSVGARRTKAALEARTIVPVDLDGGMTLDEAVARCRALGVRAIVHTTASHTHASPRLRVFIELVRGVSSAEWDAGIKGWVKDKWPEADTNALDAARISYAPMVIEGYQAVAVEGEPLDPPSANIKKDFTFVQSGPVDNERVKRLVDLFGPCIPPIGHRHGFYLALAGFMAKQLAPIAETNALVIALCTQTDAADKIAARLGMVRETYAKQASGGQVAGQTGLEEAMSHAVGAGASAIVDQAARILFGREAGQEKETARSTRRIPDTNHTYLYASIPQAAEKRVATAVNTLQILLHTDPDWAGVWQQDVFADRVYAVNPPFKLDAEQGNVSKRDISKVRCWFAARGYKANSEDTESAIYLAAAENEYHPVLEYLESCKVGQGAIEKVATKVLKTSSPLHTAMLRKFLIGACKRVLRPGCQVDTVLILVGRQGAKKTTFCRWLFGDWLKEDLSPLDSKECIREMQGSWGVELAELDKILRAEKDVVKSFISRRVDSLDRKYQRERSSPRSSVFIGTTNAFDFLRDETGERRFWPIQSDAIDVAGLTDELRNAMWGEAFAAAKRNEQHWLDDQEEIALRDLQENFRDFDPIEEKLDEIMTKEGRLTLGDIMTKLCVVAPALIKEGGGNAERVRVTRALRRIGASQYNDGKKRWWITSNVIPIEKGKKEDNEIRNHSG